ncbi:MAG: hypothetical protein HY660_00295 [Armatimonadetes bacterium]|nr:hypothetical protein [Armatimonadota bacterium]
MRSQEYSALHLRGLPADLVRRLKASAAAQGLTLTDYAMHLLERGVAGGDAEGGSPAGEFHQAVRYYRRHRATLARKYGGQYVAIVGNRVVDADPSLEALSVRVFRTLGNRDVYMPKVGEEPRTVWMRSPRVIRR